MNPLEGLTIGNLQNLRTEIVLKHANDVAFWFSLSFRVAMIQQHDSGKRAPSTGHQTVAIQETLFPIRRQHGKKNKMPGG